MVRRRMSDLNSFEAHSREKSAPAGVSKQHFSDGIFGIGGRTGGRSLGRMGEEAGFRTVEFAPTLST